MSTTLHVIGDSHASILVGREEKPFPQWPAQVMGAPGLRVYHMGPVLAWNLGEPDHWCTLALSHVLRELPAGAPVLLCFGEIDCRAHITKRALAGEASPEWLTGRCVERYLRAARIITDSGRPCMAWGPIPSARDGVHNAPDFPSHGTCQHRNAITELFNVHLATIFGQAGIPVGSLFEQLITPDGLNKEAYYHDGMHLGRQAMPMIKKALAELMEEIKQ